MATPVNVLSAPYYRLGGPDAVRSLANRFYDFVETEPEAEGLRALHLNGHGLAHAREAQFLFLSGFLGGPHLYMEANRHADVRLMHAHLVFDEHDRDAWLYCMRKAIAAEGIEPDLADRLMGSFTRVAAMLHDLSVKAGKAP